MGECAEELVRGGGSPDDETVGEEGLEVVAEGSLRILLNGACVEEGMDFVDEEDVVLGEFGEGVLELEFEVAPVHSVRGEIHEAEG